MNFTEATLIDVDPMDIDEPEKLTPFDPMDIDEPEELPPLDPMDVDSEDTKKASTNDKDHNTTAECASGTHTVISHRPGRRSVQSSLPKSRQELLLATQRVEAPSFNRYHSISQMRRLARVTSVCRKLVRRDAVDSFANTCERIWDGWMALLCETTLPYGIPSWDNRFTAAFRAVDNVISERREPIQLRWLAYVQLTRLFDVLERVLKSERAGGLAHRSGGRDVCAAIDIYEKALERRSTTPELRGVTVQTHRRIGRRWMSLAGVSPLLLLIYRCEAEAIVKDFKKTFDATLASAGSKALRDMPRQFVRSCTRLGREAESAAGSNKSINKRDIRNFVSQSMRLHILP